MRICLDIRLLAKGRPSGIVNYTSSLVGEILKSKSPEDKITLFYNGLFQKPLTEPWVSLAEVFKRRWPNRLLDFSFRFTEKPKIDELVKSDVFFSPHFTNLPLSKPSKRVITFHDLSFVHHPDFFSARQHFWHWLQNYKKQASQAGFIIAVSDFTRSDLINYFSLPPERVKTVYSGISPVYRKLQSFDPRLDAFVKKKALFKPYILYLGSLERRKNVMSLIKAFNLIKEDKLFKSWQLILAGSIGAGGKELLKEAGKSYWSKDIRFLGPVTDEEALFLYNKAGSFVYPSFFEGFGFPPLEAQACGVPVVASNRASLPEILGSSALLIDPWRIDEIAGAIKILALNSDLRNNLIHQGFRNIKRFSWERAGQETLNTLYEAGS